MTEDRNAIEGLIVDAGWVDVPDDLRDYAVVAAAVAARESRHAGWLDRVWYSTRWRVATAVTLLALTLLNGIPANTNTDVVNSFGRAAYEAAEDAAQAARRLGLPEADCQRLGDVVLAAASRPDRKDAVASKEQSQ